MSATRPAVETDLAEALGRLLPDAGPQVEISGVSQQLDLTRFSGGRIHQNVVDDASRVWVRAWTSGGSGYSVTSDLRDDSLRATIADAVERSAQVSGGKIDPPVSLASGTDAYFESTANFDSTARADLVGEVHEATGEEAVAHGNLRIARQSHAVVNNSGLSAGYRSTYAAMNLVTQSMGRATGYAGAIGRDIDQLDLVGVARRAADISLRGRKPVVVEPGRYEVLLDPPAVSMLLVSLGYVGLNVFGAAAARSSEAWHRLGRVVGSDLLSLTDDPLDSAALFSPFDAEGTRRSRLPLIDKGLVVGVAHDLTSADADGTVTTGHAMPPGDKGPSPHSLTIPAGTTSRADIISGIERGLIVNRIHPFVSLRGGPRGELSGTSRDGVFLVENGEIVAPVANVRWSNAMDDLLKSVEATSTERSVEFMDLPEFSPHTAHVPSVYSTHFTVHGSQPRER